MSLARPTDPTTSHLAAEQVTDVAGTKNAVLNILRIYGPLPDEWIHREHCHLADTGAVPRRLSPQRIRTVRSNLVDDGLVEATGATLKLPGARAHCNVWRAVK